MFVWENGLSEEERIQKNVRNLLQIRKGEIPMNRSGGVNPDIIDKLFESIDSEIYTDIVDMVEENEPRAVIDIDDVSESEEGTILEVFMSCA